MGGHGLRGSAAATGELAVIAALADTGGTGAAEDGIFTVDAATPVDTAVTADTADDADDADAAVADVKAGLEARRAAGRFSTEMYSKT